MTGLVSLKLDIYRKISQLYFCFFIIFSSKPKLTRTLITSNVYLINKKRESNYGVLVDSFDR